MELDLLDRGSAPAETDVVFERPAGRRGRAVGLGVATALAVAIGASVLSGGGDDNAAPVVTTTVAPTTTMTTESATTTAAATTTTVPKPFPVAAPPLLGEPTGLSIAVALGTDLYVIDTDTAVATPAGYHGMNEGQGAALTSLGLVINDVNGTPDLLRVGASSSEPLIDAVRTDESGPTGPVVFLGEGPPGRLWLMRYGGDRLTVGFIDAATVGAPFVAVEGADLTYGSGMPDGLGGLVFSAPGGTYRADDTGAARRVSPGQLVDVVNGQLLALECDEVLACQYRGIDLTTGASWTAAGDDATAGQLFGVVLSPDGQRFARLKATGVEPVGLGETLTVEVVGADGTETFEAEVAGFGACGFGGCGSPLVWSRDGAWLFAVRSPDSIWGWRSGRTQAMVIEFPTPVPAPIGNLSLLIGAWPTASMPVAPAAAS